MATFEETFRDELSGRRLPSWRSPFHWWGPSWGLPARRSLADLVGEDVVDPATADALRQHVRRGGSVVVAAGPSRVGKSTFADALAGELPDEVERVYVRGGYETFDFVDEADLSRTVVLVNEISPHLPVYLWGQAARRVLRMAREGSQVIATMHADSPEEVVFQLARQPIGAAPEEIAALSTLVFLGPSPADDGVRWCVVRVVRLHATGHGVRVEDVAVSG